MNNSGSWFRRFCTKISASFRHFMLGRYGTDKLNTCILWTGVVICLIAMVLPWPVARLLLTAVSYGLMIWAICRCFSRNTYRRYEENRRFLRFWERLKDRDHKYFDCPHCRQPVRVPRGKGKIAITCPKCKERFIRKT